VKIEANYVQAFICVSLYVTFNFQNCVKIFCTAAKHKQVYSWCCITRANALFCTFICVSYTKAVCANL